MARRATRGTRTATDRQQLNALETKAAPPGRLGDTTDRAGPRLTLVEWNAGVDLLEDSASVLQRRWRHRRSITPVGAGCVVTDVVEVESRLPGAKRITHRIVGRIFDRRHAVLAAEFGRR